LQGVDTATLIKFAAACLPKDMTLAVNTPPEITYISQVPRPSLEEKPREGINESVLINQDHNNGVNQGVIPEVIDTHIVTEVKQVNIP
jgi:hypothetical protein